MILMYQLFLPQPANGQPDCAMVAVGNPEDDSSFIFFYFYSKSAGHILLQRFQEQLGEVQALELFNLLNGLPLPQTSEQETVEIRGEAAMVLTYSFVALQGATRQVALPPENFFGGTLTDTEMGSKTNGLYTIQEDGQCLLVVVFSREQARELVRTYEHCNAPENAYDYEGQITRSALPDQSEQPMIKVGGQGGHAARASIAYLTFIQSEQR